MLPSLIDHVESHSQNTGLIQLQSAHSRGYQGSLQYQELLIPETIGLSLHGANLVDCALERSRRDVVVLQLECVPPLCPQSGGQLGEDTPLSSPAAAPLER